MHQPWHTDFHDDKCQPGCTKRADNIRVHAVTASNKMSDVTQIAADVLERSDLFIKMDERRMISVSEQALAGNPNIQK